MSEAGSGAMWVLTLGECGSATRVQRVLEGLHARRPVSGLLVDHACPTDAAVYCWSTHRTVEVCPVWTWPGVVAVQRGSGRRCTASIGRGRCWPMRGGWRSGCWSWGGAGVRRGSQAAAPLGCAGRGVVAEAQAMGWSGRLVGEALVAFPGGSVIAGGVVGGDGGVRVLAKLVHLVGAEAGP
ncbi:MAG: hypothetical protein R3F43_10145 [bacterium]